MLCSLSFTLSITVGYILVFHYQVILDDAMSRVMNAYYVFFRGYLHFGAIGFVWNPFPSLLEMPIAALHNEWPSLVTKGFASNIVSSAFGMVSVYYMHRILYRFGFGRASRFVWVLLFILNPMALYYNANGMSDGMLMGCLLATLSGTLAYLEERRLEALAVGAMWLAAAFMFRYEAIPFFLFTSLAIAIALWRMRQPQQETQAMLVLYAMPMVYSVLVWMFVNWLIMKNPLYFLVSPYGNASQIASGSYSTNALTAANHHLWNAIQLVFRFSLLFFPSIIGMAWAFVQQFRYRPDPRWIVLFAATLAVPLFQAVMLYVNASAGWARFFIYYIPFGICLLALIPMSFKGHLKKITLVLTTLLFVAGDVATFHELRTPIVGHGENTTIENILNNVPSATFGQEIAVSDYINAHPNLVVLADSFDTWAVIARLDRPSQCVITSDIDFQSVLANPRGRVDAILVPQPSIGYSLDAINRAYPGLWAGKVPWTHLIKEFSGSAHYRLYAVTPLAP